MGIPFGTEAAVSLLLVVSLGLFYFFVVLPLQEKLDTLSAEVKKLRESLLTPEDIEELQKSVGSIRDFVNDERTTQLINSAQDLSRFLRNNDWQSWALTALSIGGGVGAAVFVKELDNRERTIAGLVFAVPVLTVTLSSTITMQILGPPFGRTIWERLIPGQNTLSLLHHLGFRTGQLAAPWGVLLIFVPPFLLTTPFFVAHRLIRRSRFSDSPLKFPLLLAGLPVLWALAVPLLALGYQAPDDGAADSEASA